jgi:hypothetical protein
MEASSSPNIVARLSLRSGLKADFASSGGLALDETNFHQGATPQPHPGCRLPLSVDDEGLLLELGFLIGRRCIGEGAFSW